jgi:hypothetical protein
MMETCLDEGTLQAYLDGELSPETSNGVAAHLGACHACAADARAAEQELALFSTAFAPALDASVPTEKLRARLGEAIAAMDAQPQFAPQPVPARLRSYFDSFIASLTTFAPRQATAFASFLVAVALAVVFALMQKQDSPNASKEIASVRQTPAPASPVVRSEEHPARSGADATRTPVEEIETPTAARGGDRAALVSNDDDRAALVKAGARAGSRTAPTRAVRDDAPEASGTRVAAAATTTAAATTPAEPALADEKTYLSSIASLASAIEAQGAEGMTPTLRAEYERNLAVVNQAILSSRVAVRRNPQDTDAKEFLRAAYQNKVELLSAVADQTQLASGRD